MTTLQRHCERSEAIQTPLPCGEGLGERCWIASGYALAMTKTLLVVISNF